MSGFSGLVSAILISASFSTEASTISAASCAASDVQTALNRSAAGDTVLIPAGVCGWASSVTWTAPSNVTLQGAGTSDVGGGDQTVIVDNVTTGQPILSVGTNASGTFRMSGIEQALYADLSVNDMSWFRLKPGDTLRVSLPPDRLRVFEAP